MLNQLRRVFADRLWNGTVKRHKSRMGFRAAPAYTRYLARCQRDYRAEGPATPEVEAAARQFHEQGFTTLWTPETGALAKAMMAKLEAEQHDAADVWGGDGRYAANESYRHFPEMEGFLAGDLGNLYRAIFQAQFKIYYSLIYRSAHDRAGPSGSQLWHADGGPGTCINTLIYLTDTGPEHGTLECLPWAESLDLFRGERRAIHDRVTSGSGEHPRQAITEYYRDSVAARFSGRTAQPTGKAGLIVAFRNNLIHKGGFPGVGVTRYAALYHAYPSHRPTPFESYRTNGTPKRGPYPADPAGDF